jgi:hypothetical protein
VSAICTNCGRVCKVVDLPLAKTRKQSQSDYHWRPTVLKRCFGGSIGQFIRGESYMQNTTFPMGAVPFLMGVCYWRSSHSQPFWPTLDFSLHIGLRFSAGKACNLASGTCAFGCTFSPTSNKIYTVVARHIATAQQLETSRAIYI